MVKNYVLVKMQMTDAAFLMIKNTPQVTGFLGTNNKATPISDEEAMRMLNQVVESSESPRSTVTYVWLMAVFFSGVSSIPPRRACS